MGANTSCLRANKGSKRKTVTHAQAMAGFKKGRTLDLFEIGLNSNDGKLPTTLVSLAARNTAGSSKL